MFKKSIKFSIVPWLFVIAVVLLIHCAICSDVEEIFNPTTVRQFLSSYRPLPKGEYYTDNYQFRQRGPELIGTYHNEKVFQIEPSDAIDIAKYSQQAVDPQRNSPDLKVPSMTFTNVKVSVPILPHNDRTPTLQEQNLKEEGVPKKNVSKPLRDLRFIESPINQSPHVVKSSGHSEYKLDDAEFKDMQSDMSFREDALNLRSQNKNNFTNADTNLLPVSSDAILSYQTPFNNKDRDFTHAKDLLQTATEHDKNLSSHSSGKPNSSSAILNPKSFTSLENVTGTEIIFNTHHNENFNQTDPYDIPYSTPIIPSNQNEANLSSGIPMPNTGHEKFSSGTVAGIVIAVLVCVTILSSAVIYLLYRKYNGKCTSVVEGKFNTDNCGYLDDSLRSSIYLNNHIELPKESSEEMSSLDNDSFLNSLETMTIQNYWADTSKNTKV